MAVTPALPRCAGRRTNLALLGLLLLAFATGVLAYRLGTPTAAAVVVAIHDAAGLGLLLLVPWKAVIVRRRAGGPDGTATLSPAVTATLIDSYVDRRAAILAHEAGLLEG